MIVRKLTLHDDIMATFERACREHDYDVAEGLLQIIEAIARRTGSEDQLQRAYRILVVSSRNGKNR